MQVTINKTSQGFQITRIIDGSFTYNFRTTSIFSLRVLNVELGTSSFLTASSFQNQNVIELPDGSVKITYYNQNVLPGNVKVHVFGKIGENHEADLRCEVYFRVNGYILEYTDFPRYSVGNFSSTGNDNILAFPQPSHDGLLYRNPGSGSTTTMSFPGSWSAQTYTLFNPINEQCLYFQAMDLDAWSKEVVWFGEGTGTFISNRFYTVNPQELTDSKIPYYLRIKGLTGDLYDSALKYRDWVTGNEAPWLSKNKIYESGSLHNNAVKNQRLGYIQNLLLETGKDGFAWVLQTLENLQYGLALARNEQSCIWYDWWNRLYADSSQWPEFPLLTGRNNYAPDFRSSAISGQALGYNIVPYTLPFDWDTDSLDTEYIKQYPYRSFLVKSIENSDLTYREYFESQGVNTTDVTDTTSPYWQSMIRDEYNRLAMDIGFSGFYLDVYQQGSSRTYDQNALKRGPVRDIDEGWKKAFDLVKQDTIGTGGLMYSEYSSEKNINFISSYTIIGLTDAGSNSVLQRQSPYFSFIYSDYQRHGSLPFLTQVHDMYNTYLNGYYPTFAIASAANPPVIGNMFSSPSVPYVFLYAASLAAIQIFSIFRNQLDPYVLAGQKLRPISGGLTYEGYRTTGTVGTNPVNYNAWLTPTGSIGVIITNGSFTDTNTATIRLPGDKYPFISGHAYDLWVFTGSIFPFTGSGWNNSGTYTGGYTGTYTIPPLDVKLLEFRP